ncbi:MAG: chloride channel protein [Candidatus Omnitrophica bacterium]|nr:chloride channel protein [Candidatus Omnitrophota bacterium]
MENKWKEIPVTFFSIVKWTVLAIFVGALVGLATTLFLKTLEKTAFLTNRYSYYYIFLPFALFLSGLIIKYLAPDAEGHGTEKVIEAIHKFSGKIKWSVIPAKLVASVITISFGGSAGKEGPCAQIGGGIASLISDIFRFDDIDRKKLVICGISAGFASVFGTPISGAIFGIEVLFIGNILYEVLLPSFISAIVGYYVSSELGIKYFHHSINFVPFFCGPLLIRIIFLGILFGLVALFMIETMELTKKISSKIRLWQPLNGLIGGTILVILTFIFSDHFLGLGIETIKSTLKGEEVLWYFFILKIVFTAITLNFCGSGGVITPIFFIGATSGKIFSNLLGMDKKTVSAIGLVSVLAGATNTPIASSIMAIELFGSKIGPYAAISCIVSFLITGTRSIYPSQIIAIRKTSSIHVDIGKEISKVKPRIKVRRKTFTNIILTTIRKFKEKIKGGENGKNNKKCEG